jgi:hypothetical protein
VRKGEDYWVRSLTEHDTEAMINEVIDLNHSIYDGHEAGTISEQQIVVRAGAKPSSSTSSSSSTAGTLRMSPISPRRRG